MTVLTRGARVRRGGRRPGWVLLTALLVLAIGASSALVFTNQVKLLKLAVILALWARYVRGKISEGEIGMGPGWLHPLAVARTVMVAKASAWVGALVLGWWVGVLVYFLPRRSWLRVAAEDTTGTVVAAISALALVVAALWLQHCCKSPQDPTEHGEGAES